nr:hypothetical protein [Tanacetum cinerariifolium]
MATLKFCDTQSLIAYLNETEGSEGFHQIVDFLNSNHIKFALTENPTIYTSLIQQFLQTAIANTLDTGEIQITTKVDGNPKLISESSIRRHLKLEDSDGISTLPNTKIFEQLALMGASKGYTWVDIPLFPTMLVQGLQSEGSTVPVESHHTPLGDPTISQPQHSLPSRVPTPPYDSPLLGDATRVHTYSRRRRAVSTGSGEVSTASRIISTAKEIVSTADVSMPNIRARVEADEELTQRLQAEEREKYSRDDKTKMLVDLINQRKKFFAQQRAKAKRNTPMTQAQQRTYMSNYIKHMGSYTLKWLKKLSFEEINELFKATIRRIQDFVPMEREGDKEVSMFPEARGSKRDAEEELDQGSSKKQKTDDASGSVQGQPVE